MNTPDLNESFWSQHLQRTEKYYVLYLGERNLRVSNHFCELSLSRKIHIHRKESFAYGLPDFPRKDNALLGSKLTSYFKQQPLHSQN